MCRLWVMGGLAAILSAGNFGCYLDQLQAEKRANRVLREEFERSQKDLLAADAMNRQKDTEIDALNKQLAAKDETVASMSAENTKLRDSLTKAEEILEKMAGKPGIGDIRIVRQALPEGLSNALQQLASEYPELLEFDPRTGAVRWKADVLFPLGSDQMTSDPELLAAMKRFAEIVNSADAAGFDVVVVGHTCNTRIAKPETRAEHKTNWHLSAHRAISVMNLLKDDGVDMGRLGVMGYGEYRPIAENTSEAGKKQNRRVEIYLVQQDSVRSFSGEPGIYETQDENLTFAKPSELGSPPAETAGRPAQSPPKLPNAGE